MSQGLEIQAPCSPERDITRLLPLGCLSYVSAFCRNKAPKSVGGHKSDASFTEGSGAKSLQYTTVSVEVWFQCFLCLLGRWQTQECLFRICSSSIVAAPLFWHLHKVLFALLALLLHKLEKLVNIWLHRVIFNCLSCLMCLAFILLLHIFFHSPPDGSTSTTVSSFCSWTTSHDQQYLT